jgi:V8-like Glu-specific endopeptidase
MGFLYSDTEQFHPRRDYLDFIDRLLPVEPALWLPWRRPTPAATSQSPQTGFLMTKQRQWLRVDFTQTGEGRFDLKSDTKELVPGMSGGPLLDEDGKAIGVYQGGSQGTSEMNSAREDVPFVVEK